MREIWWENDDAPQYLTEDELKLQPSLDRLRSSVDLSGILDESKSVKANVAELLYLAKSDNAAGVAAVVKRLAQPQLSANQNRSEYGEHMLRPHEKQLLDNYSACTDEGKAAILATAAALAQAAAAKTSE